MSITVSAVGQLILVIRQQLQAQRRSDAGTGQSVRLGSTSKKADPHKLENLIRRRIQEIQEDDPQRGKKAFRVFLETILLTTFGDSLLHHPQFFSLVDDVQRAMEEQTDIASLTKQAIDSLLNKAV